MADLIDELALPAPGARRLAIRVTPDAVRRLRGGHPWLYDGSIDSVSHDGEPGDLGVVFDRDRKFAAIGLWDPTSPIQLKVLHAGSPTTIDAEWFADRLGTAVARRAPLWRDADRAMLGYRAVNGENDGLPGLVVDVYAAVAVVKLYTPAWFAHLRPVVDAAIAATGATTVVLRLARSVAGHELTERVGADDGDVIVGDPIDGPVLFTENGLTLEADVRAGQKTGHFLDQRTNHRIVRNLARGLDVLDVFASTGGFTAHAAAGGASSVHAVDISQPTLAVTERNLAHNASNPRVSACRVTTEVGDAFEVMERMTAEHRRFGMVIVDPPSFAQNAASIKTALGAYTRLTHLALSLVVDGGILVQASCSSRVTAADFFERIALVAEGRAIDLTLLRRTGHDIDHPVTFPEGAYLKAGVWRVERRARPGSR
ncbi:MAG: class I SAM-dependent methyltransferase [Actinomycetota bacterium]